MEIFMIALVKRPDLELIESGKRLSRIAQKRRIEARKEKIYAAIALVPLTLAAYGVARVLGADSQLASYGALATDAYFAGLYLFE